MEKLKTQLPKKVQSLSETKLREMIRKEIKRVQTEGLEDMEVSLPGQVEKFVDKAVNTVKGYNLNKKKEQLVLAKMVDALDMDKNQLMQAFSRIKKSGITQKKD